MALRHSWCHFCLLGCLVSIVGVTGSRCLLSSLFDGWSAPPASSHYYSWDLSPPGDGFVWTVGLLIFSTYSVILLETNQYEVSIVPRSSHRRCCNNNNAAINDEVFVWRLYYNKYVLCTTVQLDIQCSIKILVIAARTILIFVNTNILIFF